jgi:hypothetical protein
MFDRGYLYGDAGTEAGFAISEPPFSRSAEFKNHNVIFFLLLLAEGVSRA